MTKSTYTTDLLIAQLTSDDTATRFDAASLIGIDQVHNAAGALVARLGAESDCQVRERITWAAVRIIDSALPGVLDTLGSADPEARSQAAHILSKTPRPEFAAHLAALVADADPTVAIKAYRAAANTGSPEVAELLATRLGHGDALQRDALTTAFVTIGTDGVPVLTAALSDADPAVRAHAAETLGHLGEAADPAAEALTAAASDPDPEVRVAALTALGQLGEVADVPLAGLAEASDGLTRAIAASLLSTRTARVR